MTWTGGVSYVTVATPSAKRYFDLDAVRTDYKPQSGAAQQVASKRRTDPEYDGRASGVNGKTYMNGAGAPPLDWHIEGPDWRPPAPEQGTDVTARLIIGDTRDVTATIPDGTIDLIVTSPPFLDQRDYLSADHPWKDKEIGHDPTPADFLDTLLALTAEWRRVLAPHGSICVELGDKYTEAPRKGWPLRLSLAGIPTLYTWSLAYGRNLLTGQPSPAGQWRIRNLIAWARPNPPVGALGDKFRPATSYITVACTSAKRWFDLDAVRTPHDEQYAQRRYTPPNGTVNGVPGQPMTGRVSDEPTTFGIPAGAPPLDWHSDMPDEDGDWLWKLATAPYKGAHYATYPYELPRRLIDAMCPRRVCTTCGKPSERISEAESSTTLGWTDCGHDTWRNGMVLDPFAGSGTTLEAATALGRDSTGIDLDPRNAHLAEQRCGMFLAVDNPDPQPVRGWVDVPLPAWEEDAS